MMVDQGGRNVSVDPTQRKAGLATCFPVAIGGSARRDVAVAPMLV